MAALSNGVGFYFYFFIVYSVIPDILSKTFRGEAMYQEEILKAIKEQTEAIKLQTEAIELISRNLDIDTLIKALVPAIVRKLKSHGNLRLDAENISLDLDKLKRRTDVEFSEASRKKAIEKRVAKGEQTK